MGITVLCLYPTPNGLNPPSSLYINLGFVTCIIAINIKNIKIEIFILFVRIKRVLITPEIDILSFCFVFILNVKM